MILSLIISLVVGICINNFLKACFLFSSLLSQHFSLSLPPPSLFVFLNLADKVQNGRPHIWKWSVLVTEGIRTPNSHLYEKEVHESSFSLFLFSMLYDSLPNFDFLRFFFFTLVVA